MNELFHKCLFPATGDKSDECDSGANGLSDTQAAGHKCKTEDSRKWGYKLLWTLCNSSPKLLAQLLREGMVPLCDQIKLYNKWNYVPSSDSKSSKFVGLRNLGCICYMNSMLQQFYMIPSFRHLLLKADDGQPEDMQEYKGQVINDNVLHQLQSMFGHLELSERQDFNPFEFCFSFKDFDGQPTNTAIQHDSQEFLNVIFDRIENLIKPTPQKYLLEDTFGGVNCSQMICLECGFMRNRFEKFFNFSLTVKEKKSVNHSLDSLLEGETISDYNCPGCKKKVDISKRTLITETPNVLIVHLQRITFNFETFQNEKINTRFEFPNILDLTEYSLNHVLRKEEKIPQKDAKIDEDAPKVPVEEDEDDDLTAEEKEEKIQDKADFEDAIKKNDDECFEFKLVGMIIHMGTADAGHYYSLINTDRMSGDSNEQEQEWVRTENDKWMEFNDSHVKNWDFADLEDECFGGSKGGSGGEDVMSGFFRSSAMSFGKSAYLLVYEKKEKNKIRQIVQTDDTQPLECDDAVISRDPEGRTIIKDPKTKEEYVEFDVSEIKRFVPSKIYNKVQESNLDFFFEKLIYSTEFFEFVKELMVGARDLNLKREVMSAEEKVHLDEISVLMAKVGSKIVLEVLAKAYYNFKMNDVTDLLISMFDSSDEACKSFMETVIQDDCTYIKEILLKCPDKISRTNTAKLMSAVANRLFDIEKDIIHEVVEEEGPNGEKIKYSKSLAVRFLDNILTSLTSEAPASWSKFYQYLELVRNMIKGGKTQLEVVMTKVNGISYLIDFILGNQSPFAKPTERRPVMGGAYGKPDFGPLIDSIAYMIRNGYTPNFTKDSTDKPSTVHPEADHIYTLTPQDQELFLHPLFLETAMSKQQTLTPELGFALAHWSYKDEAISRLIGLMLLRTLNNSAYEQIEGHMQIVQPFLMLNDDFKMKRAEWILGASALQT